MENRQMKKIISVSCIMLAFLFILSACSKDDEKDTEKPIIEMSAQDAFPKPCDTLHIGENFIFRATFTDNVALGAYNLEIHHNFDQHTHGSHNEICPLDPPKEPVNPFYLNESFDIPANSQRYTASKQVYIPPDADPGDYHFMIRVTDSEGWQSWSSVSVKLSDR
jgi:hypothetical protein